MPDSAPFPQEWVAAPPRVGGRRTVVRYPSPLLGSCRPARTNKRSVWAARVRDVSAVGLGLLVRRRFEPGTVLAVEELDAAGAGPALVLVAVVHATAQRGGVWLLGCKFVKELGAAEIRALR
jgi:hypothetical protein